jgi:nitrate/nitrite transporter NarK
VAGFGLAPVYLAPLSKYLVENFQLQKSMLFLGAGFLVAIVGLSQLLVNPPAGYVAATAPGAAVKPVVAGSSPSEILRTPIFWVLWMCYFIGSGAGLMVIGSISGMAKKSMGAQAFIAVAVMAIGNASGRVIAGILSDRIGRRTTLMLVLLIQAVLMFAAIPITASGDAKLSIVLVAALIGANYGANLSLFPSFTKDLWGIRNFGLNYGVLFTAWGVGGLILPRVQQMLTKSSGGSFQSSFITAGALLVVGAALTLLIKPRPAGS